MHREIRDRLEEVLAQSDPGPHADHKHLSECAECRGEVTAMRQHAALLAGLRAPEIEPRAGFYARVMERIEAQGAGSIWSLFFESSFGRRIAVASLALVLLLGVFLITSERGEEAGIAATSGEPLHMIAGEDQPGMVLGAAPDRDSVLVNLVTYQEQ